MEDSLMQLNAVIVGVCRTASPGRNRSIAVATLTNDDDYSITFWVCVWFDGRQEQQHVLKVSPTDVVVQTTFNVLLQRRGVAL